EPLYIPPNINPNSVLLLLFNIQKIEYWDTVSKYLDDNYKITNSEARKITGVNDTVKMSRLLKSWVNQGLLEQEKSRFKGATSYKKVGSQPSKIFVSPLANGTANGTDK
ncbi:MAG TPA: hypothetical protein VMW66_03755, partial [Elusimicrobiales bacterium]|nr:hypothetical protein [Elusimicrobiales bacterium]